MKKTALLMSLAGLAVSTAPGAQAVNDSGYQGNAAYGAPTAAVSDNAMYEILGRLEQLQSEVQQLRGMVEEQAQTIHDLERKQGNMYSDLDERLQLLTGNNPQAAAQATPTTPAATATAGGAAPAAAGASPAVAAAAVAPQVSAATATVSAPVPTAAPAATPAAAAPQVSPEAKPTVAPAVTLSNAAEKERYQAAYDTLRNGHNAQAIQLFEALQRDFPAGEYGDNTLYWLGEAYKINREFDKARAAFGKVVSQYPNSSKVPDALLKLGYIEFDQQNMAKARDYLTRVTTSYASSTAAHLAAKKLAQMPQ